MSARSLPATLMRGGARKALFLHQRDLPTHAADRDALIARLLGSPDPAGAQSDGLGGSHSSGGQVVIVSPSRRDDCDVDALFGSVAALSGEIDWSGGEGELVAATGVFALLEALHPCTEGVSRVRIWHGGARARIDALVPVRDGRVLERGAFCEDGVPFGSAEIRLEFLDPTDGGRTGPLLPSGSVGDRLEVAGLGEVPVTVLGGGWPAVFVRAASLGLSGRESLAQLERDRRLKSRMQALMLAVANRFGLSLPSAQGSLLGAPAPTLVWVAPPAAYRATSGTDVMAVEIDLVARSAVQGQVMAAVPASVSVAIAVAAALPGTLVNEVARTLPGVPTRIGHPGGAAAAGADVGWRQGRWEVEKVVISHGARRLMSGRAYA